MNLTSIICRILFMLTFGWGLMNIINGTNIEASIFLCVLAVIFPLIDTALPRKPKS